jgi:hypothetical protein
LGTSSFRCLESWFTLEDDDKILTQGLFTRGGTRVKGLAGKGRSWHITANS